MKKIHYLFILFFLFAPIGCNGFLDILPDDKPELKDAFKDQYNAEKYLFTCYRFLPTFVDPLNTLGLTGGGDILYSDIDRATSLSSGPPASMISFLNGNMVSDPYMNFWDGRNGANRNLWQGIRHCNVFLENIQIEDGGPQDLTEDLRAQWVAEVKTIKAYLHFYLLRLYGPIPIMDKALPISATGDEVNVYREPVDKVVDYIVETLDDAMMDLPFLNNLDAVSEFGRMTKTIALSIKAQTLVLAASPIFNNNNYYSGFKDKRGVELFPEGDSQERWERALKACDEACRSAEADGAVLHVSTDGGGGAITDINSLNINDTTKAMISLRQAVTDSWNREVIWATNESTTALQQFSTMLSNVEWMRNPSSAAYMGQRHGPTLNVVEMFYSSNGVPIDEDADWAANNWYIDRYQTQLPDESHTKYYIKEGQETAVLYFNRSNRFYASVGFDGGIWEGRDRRIAESSYPNFFYNMGCGIKNYGGTGNFNPAGHLAKKLSHLKTQYTETVGNPRVIERYAFPIIRLADMYLLLAESLNEVGGPDQTDSKGNNAYYYLDRIRDRSGMNGVVDSWRRYAIDEYKNKPSTVEGLRDIIRRERLNELAFEGHFYYDVRRWLIAEDLFNKPILGWNSRGTTKQEFFNITILAEPRFSMRDYLMPIRTNTLLQNNNLVQNPGW